MSIEAMAIEFVAATKKRAQARTHLSTLRRKWLDETGEFFDKDESRGGEEEPYEEMMAAIKGREDANADYRRAKSRLFRACASGVKACGACPGDGSICKTECRLAKESPPVPAAEWIQCDRCGKPWNRGAEPFGHACGVPACPESGKHCRPIDGECQTCGALGVGVPPHQTFCTDTPTGESEKG